VLDKRGPSCKHALFLLRSCRQKRATHKHLHFNFARNFPNVTFAIPLFPQIGEFCLTKTQEAQTMRQHFYMKIYWVVIFALSIGYADVKKQTKSEVSLGPMGSMIVTELVQIKGNKMYNQSLSEMKGSGMLGFAMQSMGATTNQITITDLDKQVTYVMDMNEKTYREIPFDTYKTMLQSWKTTMQQTREEMENEEHPEKPTHKVLRNKFKINKKSRYFENTQQRWYYCNWI